MCWAACPGRGLVLVSGQGWICPASLLGELWEREPAQKTSDPAASTPDPEASENSLSIQPVTPRLVPPPQSPEHTLVCSVAWTSLPLRGSSGEGLVVVPGANSLFRATCSYSSVGCCPLNALRWLAGFKAWPFSVEALLRRPGGQALVKGCLFPALLLVGFVTLGDHLNPVSYTHLTLPTTT